MRSNPGILSWGVATLGGLLLLAGCAGTRGMATPAYTADLDPEQRVARYQTPIHRLGPGLGLELGEIRERYAHEPYYAESVPAARVGLALSGGGVRSASFSIGVLKALSDLGVLDEVDAISSVSGGSYAAYWYFSQLHWMHRLCQEGSEEELLAHAARFGVPIQEAKASSCSRYARQIFQTQWDFKDPSTPVREYRFQNALEQRSSIYGQNRDLGGKSSDLLKTLGTLLLQVGSVPFELLLNGVFDFDWNLAPLQGFYRSQLDRIYGFVPIDTSEDLYVNDTRWLLGWEHQYPVVPFKRLFAKRVSFPSLAESVEATRAPYWIINTRGGLGILTDWSVLTPGWLREMDALQQPVANANYEFSLKQHGSDLFGYREHDPKGPLSVSEAVVASGAAVDGGELRGLAGFLITLLNADLGSHISNPSRSSWHRLLHSLLPWPLYSIDDYLSISASIDSEMGVNSNTIYVSDGGFVENLGVFSLVRRGMNKIIIVDGEHDPETSFSSLKKLKRSLLYELGISMEIDTEELNGAFDVTFPENSVLTGTMSGLRRGDRSETIDFVYIKLAMDREQLPGRRTRRPELPDYHPHVTQWGDRSEVFPQTSTADISFSREQFLAYRRLGRDLTCSASAYRALQGLLGVANREAHARSDGSDRCPPPR